jgi:hypothetical protein
LPFELFLNIEPFVKESGVKAQVVGPSEGPVPLPSPPKKIWRAFYWKHFKSRV